jgi:hypothetical protein
MEPSIDPYYGHVEVVYHPAVEGDDEHLRFYRGDYYLRLPLRDTVFTWPAADSDRMCRGTFAEMMDEMEPHLDDDWPGEIHISWTASPPTVHRRTADDLLVGEPYAHSANFVEMMMGWAAHHVEQLRDERSPEAPSPYYAAQMLEWVVLRFGDDYSDAHLPAIPESCCRFFEESNVVLRFFRTSA